jgi:hypothetical protein
MDWIYTHNLVGGKIEKPTPPAPPFQGGGDMLSLAESNETYSVSPPNAPDTSTLYSLLRLRIPSQYFTHEKHFLPVLEGAALIREIHTFGEQLGI